MGALSLLKGAGNWLGRGLKSGGKFLGKVAKSGAKSLGRMAKSFGDQVIEDTKPRGSSGSSLSMDSFINPLTEGIHAVRDSFSQDTPDSRRVSDLSGIPQSQGSDPTNLTGLGNKPTVVSYKDIPPINLNSDKKEAIEEFIRHNKEVEKLMQSDIETDEKLGRDKLGRDILESERAEAHRKLAEENAAKAEKEAKEKEEAERLEREKREQELADKLAAERSKGKLEGDESKSNSDESGDSDDSDDGLGFGIGGLGIGGLLLPILGKLLKSPLKAVKWLAKKGWNGLKWVGSKAWKGTKWLGNKAWQGTKWLGSKAISGAKWIGGKVSSAASTAAKTVNKALTPILKPIKSSVSKLVNLTKSLGTKIATAGSNLLKSGKSFFNKITDKVKKVVSPVVTAIKKPISKIANVVKDNVINPAKKFISKVGDKIMSSRVAKAAKFMANPKALGKLGKKMLSKILPTIPKLTAKLGMTMAKAGGKTALKQVPLLGAALGIGEAISDIVNGDYIGAGLAALGGIAPTLNLVAPGVGTAISMGAIGADIARDIFKEPVKDAIKVFDESDPATIENEPEVDLSQSINTEEKPEARIEELKRMRTPSGSQAVTKETDIAPKSHSDKPQASPQGTSPQGPSPTESKDNSPYSLSQNQVYSNPLSPSGNQSYGGLANIEGSQLERAKRAMAKFTDSRGLGLEPHQAAGIVGCLMSESGMNPAAFNDAEKYGTATKKGIKHLPTGYGAGLPQWTYGRKTDILNYVNSKTGRNYSRIEEIPFEDQLDAIEWEFKNKRPRILEKLRKASDYASAADIVLRGYENGSNSGMASRKDIDRYTWGGGYQGAMYGNRGRATYAKSILNAYNSGFNPTGVNTDASISDSRAKSTPKWHVPMAAPKSKSSIPGFTPFANPDGTLNLPFNGTKSKGKRSTSRSGAPGLVAMNKGGDTFAPQITGGSNSNTTIYNIHQSDQLGYELG